MSKNKTQKCAETRELQYKCLLIQVRLFFWTGIRIDDKRYTFRMRGERDFWVRIVLVNDGITMCIFAKPF